MVLLVYDVHSMNRALCMYSTHRCIVTQLKMDIKTKRNNKVDGIARIHEHRNEATTEAMLHTVLTDSRNETTLKKTKKKSENSNY